MKLDRIKKLSINELTDLKNKSEFTIQCEIIAYCRARDILCFSVPNEATRNNSKYIKSGVLAGVSDLILYLDGEVHFIELKDYKGRQSEAQKEFESKVKNYHLIRSLEEFLPLITRNQPFV